jgi:DNA-binding transcriptional ArsR family regulator
VFQTEILRYVQDDQLNGLTTTPGGTMTPKSPFPPAYVNVPVSIACAGVDNGLIVTMIRILALCWAHKHERTPPLTARQLADLIGRPPSTLHRHLVLLEEELGWLRIDRRGRQLVLRPLVAQQAAARQPACRAPSGHREGGRDALRQALAEAGIENPARDRLARDAALDPAWVRGWRLWTRHPDRAGLTNPAGLIVQRLQNGEPPPDDYLKLAALTREEKTCLEESCWIGSGLLNGKLARLRPLYLEITRAERRE